jgi:hypothetical protein
MWSRVRVKACFYAVLLGPPMLHKIQKFGALPIANADVCHYVGFFAADGECVVLWMLILGD